MSEKVGPTNRPIPADWRIASLKSVSLNGAKNGFFKKPELVGSGYKLVNVSELYQPFGIDTRLESVERVDATPADHAKYGVEDGDIFFTRSSLVLSGIAACNIVRNTWEPTLFECHVMKMSPDKSKVFPEFIAYCCRDSYSRSYLMAQAKQTTMTTISQPEIEQLPVPVAPLHEQRKIARILTTLDELIEKTEALIAKYQAIKQGMMHDLFTRGVDEHGHLRPTYDEAPELYKESELGWIPKEWETRTLNDLVSQARPIVYGILMPGYGFPGGIPVIKVKDIKHGVIDRSDILLTSPDIDFAYRRSRTTTGDLLFTIRGTVGRTAFVPDTLDGANITQDTARIGIVDGDPRFIRGYLEMPIPQKFIACHTLGVAVQGINLGDVRRISVAFPPLAEQSQLGDMLEANDRRMQTEQCQLDKLRLQKTGLMQDLLTGKVRVKPDEGGGDV